MRKVNLVTFSLVPSTPSLRREEGLVNLDTILGTGKYDSPTTAIQSAIACCINLNCRPDSRLISRLTSLLQCWRSLVPRPSSAREERGRVWNITPGGSVPKECCAQVIMTHNYRMAQPTQWVPAILDYMKKAQSPYQRV